ncbi:hypothetical protein [Streptomyces erythrochromogenes]|uniref:hypothetical protein n=1 Tax=Streptomyces erythrochromogenes TaxID=285574 RepID=UPI00344895FF
MAKTDHNQQEGSYDMSGFPISETEDLVKRWVQKARENAKQNGERPVYYSQLSQSDRRNLFREAAQFIQLARGEMLERCVPPRPTQENITAMGDRLAHCVAALTARIDARGDDFLPPSTRHQLEVLEQRIAVALDIVQNAPELWSREADAAWSELMRWAHKLDDRPFDGRRKDPWAPEGWGRYSF